MPPVIVNLPVNGTQAVVAAALDTVFGTPSGLYDQSAPKYLDGRVIWLKPPVGSAPPFALLAMFEGTIRYCRAGQPLPAPWSGTPTYDSIVLMVGQGVSNRLSRWLRQVLWPKQVLYRNVQRDLTEAAVVALLTGRAGVADPTAYAADWVANRSGDIDVTAGAVMGHPAIAPVEWENPPAPANRATWKASAIAIRTQDGVVDFDYFLDAFEAVTAPAAEIQKFPGQSTLWDGVKLIARIHSEVMNRIRILAEVTSTETVPLTSSALRFELIHNHATGRLSVPMVLDPTEVDGSFVVHGALLFGSYWIEPPWQHNVLTRSAELASGITRPTDVTVALVGSPPTQVVEVTGSPHTVPTHLPFAGMELRIDDRDPGTYAGGALPAGAPTDVIARLREALETAGIYLFRAGARGTRGRFSARVQCAVRELQMAAHFPKLAYEIHDPSLTYPARIRQVDNNYTTQTGEQLPDIHGYLDGRTLRFFKWFILRDLRYPRVTQEREKAGAATRDGGPSVWREFTGDPARPGGSSAYGKSAARNNLWWWNDQPEPKTTTGGLFTVDLSGMYETNPADVMDLPHPVATMSAYPYRQTGFMTSWDPDDAGPQPLQAGLSGGVSVDNKVGYAARELTRGALGLDASAEQTFQVVEAVCKLESLGSLDVVQGYDNRFFSLPLYHYILADIRLDGAGLRLARGEIAALLAFARTLPGGEDAIDAALRGVTTEFPYAALPRSNNGTILGALELRRVNASGSIVTSKLEPTDEDHYRWFSSHQWFYRFVMMLRSQRVWNDGAMVDNWGVWRLALWRFAQVRIKRILEAPWPAGNAATGVGAGAKVGDVFKSRATVAMLLRWHVKAPSEILAVADGSGHARLRAVLADAIVRGGAGATWGPAGGTPNPSTWGEVHERLLAHSIRRIARSGGADGTSDGGVRNAMSQMWPEDPPPPPPPPPSRPATALPLEYASRDFILADPDVPI